MEKTRMFADTVSVDEAAAEIDGEIDDEIDV